MTKEHLNLIVWQFRTVGAGYALAQSLQGHEVEILELSYLGTGTLLIVNTQKQSASAIMKRIESENSIFTKEILAMKVLESFPALVFKTYLSLTTAQLDQNLVIYESDFIGDIFEVASQLPIDQILDLRLLRGSQAKAIMMVNQDSNFKVANMATQVQVTEIEKPEFLKSFFNLEPQKNIQ